MQLKLKKKHKNITSQYEQYVIHETKMNGISPFYSKQWQMSNNNETVAIKMILFLSFKEFCEGYQERDLLS